MKNQFTTKAVKALRQVYEYAVFALNIPMKESERNEIKKHIEAIAEILTKY